MAAIVRQTGLAKFEGEGYLEWAKSMKAVMLEKELWEVVCDRPSDRPAADAPDSEKSEWSKKQGRAYGLLQLSLDTSMLVLVSHCTTAHGIWAELRRQLDKPSWTRRLRLRQSFHSLVMAEATSVRDHIVRLKSLVDELGGLGDVVSEDLVVIQLLNSLPPSYHGLLTALENIQPPTALNPTIASPSSSSSGAQASGRGAASVASTVEDFDAVRAPEAFPLSLSYVTSTLMQEEERRTRLGIGVEGIMQLRGYSPHDPHPRDQKKRDKTRDECHYCGKTGHWARECWLREKDKASGIVV